MSMWPFIRTDSKTGTSIVPFADLESETSCVRGPGSGHNQVHTCIMTTPSEKQSSFFVYFGGSLCASGGMYANVPGHMVKEVFDRVSSDSFDISKSVTLALLTALINMLLLRLLTRLYGKFNKWLA